MPRASDSCASHVTHVTLGATGLRFGETGHSFCWCAEGAEVCTYGLYSVSLPLGSCLNVELVPVGLEVVGASSLLWVLKYDGGSASRSRELLDGVAGLDMARGVRRLRGWNSVNLNDSHAVEDVKVRQCCKTLLMKAQRASGDGQLSRQAKVQVPLFQRPLVTGLPLENRCRK
jgi:hypothetical protein